MRRRCFLPAPQADDHPCGPSRLSERKKELMEATERAKLRDTMLFVGGAKQSFRCACGANVFKRLPSGKYDCNGCGAIYTPESDEPRGVEG